MYRLKLQLLNIDLELMIARKRAAECVPYSPAWDAAMAHVEDLERDAWHLAHVLDHVTESPPAPLPEASNP